MTYTLREPPLNYRYCYFRLYHRLAILSPEEIVAKTTQCCKRHCYVRDQAYCYVPPQTFMKVSRESGREIRAEIQTFGLSPKLVPAELKFHGLPRIPAQAWERA